MIKCKECGNELFQGENSIGKPLEYDICTMCWEDLDLDKYNKYIKDGVVPITRSVMNKSWIRFCSKYNMKPQK